MRRTPQPGWWKVAYFRFVHFSSCVKRHVPRWTRRSPNRTSQRFPRKIWQRGGKHGPSYFVAFRLLDRWDRWISSSSLTCFMQYTGIPAFIFCCFLTCALMCMYERLHTCLGPVAFGATNVGTLIAIWDISHLISWFNPSLVQVQWNWY